MCVVSSAVVILSGRSASNADVLRAKLNNNNNNSSRRQMAAAILGRKQGLAAMASNLVRSVLTRPSSSSSNLVGSGRRSLTGGGAVTSEIITTHTEKWMQVTTPLLIQILFVLIYLLEIADIRFKDP